MMTGRGLRRIRRRLGLTQVELAEELGRHPQTVSEYERGVLEVPKLVEGYMRLLDEREKNELERQP